MRRGRDVLLLPPAGGPPACRLLCGLFVAASSALAEPGPRLVQLLQHLVLHRRVLPTRRAVRHRLQCSMAGAAVAGLAACMPCGD